MFPTLFFSNSLESVPMGAIQCKTNWINYSRPPIETAFKLLFCVIVRRVSYPRLPRWDWWWAWCRATFFQKSRFNPAQWLTIIIILMSRHAEKWNHVVFASGHGREFQDLVRCFGNLEHLTILNSDTGILCYSANVEIGVMPSSSTSKTNQVLESWKATSSTSRTVRQNKHAFMLWNLKINIWIYCDHNDLTIVVVSRTRCSSPSNPASTRPRSWSELIRLCDTCYTWWFPNLHLNSKGK